MTRFKKLLSFVLCLLFLLSTVISCAPAETQTTDDSTGVTTDAATTETLDTASPELTIEKLTNGFTYGEYTLNDTPVRSHELFTTLYRIAGEPEASRDFEVVWNIGEKDSYYYDAMVWSAFEARIVPFHAEIMATDGNDMPAKLGETFRVGDRTTDDIIKDTLQYFKDAKITKITPEMDFDTDVTRADAVLSMYYYVTTYLGRDVSEGESANSFSDANQLVSFDSKIYKSYISSVLETSAAWSWALDAGIVEAYPDNTLRPDTILTRADFATMLTRFIDYVK
ncbi:MAG: S-layer homology domain-containing protein [Clostridia bacterium]|nr:S-layer homology domain-containing protein [Clostridia bacterium]